MFYNFNCVSLYYNNETNRDMELKAATKEVNGELIEMIVSTCSQKAAFEAVGLERKKGHRPYMVLNINPICSTVFYGYDLDETIERCQ